MKKKIKFSLLAVTSVLAVGVMALSACGGEKVPEKVSDVIAAVNALPSVEQLSLSDKSKVKSARDKYNALKNADKGLVTNLDKLDALEAQVKILLAIDGLEMSFTSDTAMLVSDVYTPVLEGYAYNSIETTVVYELKDAGTTGAVYNDGTITVTDCGTFTVGASVSYKGCNIIKEAECNVEVGIEVSGTVSFAEGFEEVFEDVTVTIGTHTVVVNSDGTWTSVTQYGDRVIYAESSNYIAKPKEVTVAEGATELGELELSLYKIKDDTGKNSVDYDWENGGYKVVNTNSGNFKGSQVSFPALTAEAGAEFEFGIQLASTDLDPVRTLRQGITVTSGDMFYLICLNKNGNNGTSSVRVFKDIVGSNVSNDTKALTTSVTLPRALTDDPIGITLLRIKENGALKWFFCVEQGEIKQLVSLTQGGVPEELATLDSANLSFGVGGMDDRLADTENNNVIWKQPTLKTGDAAGAAFRHTAEVTIEKDESDTVSTATLSAANIFEGGSITLTVTPKTSDNPETVYAVTATLNNEEIVLTNNNDGTFSYTITNVSDDLSFAVNVEMRQTKTIEGRLSCNSALIGTTDFTGATVSIGSYAATVTADGSWTATVPYGNYTVTISHPLFTAKAISNVTVNEAAFTSGNFEFDMYAATGRGFKEYDYESKGYKVVNTNSGSFKGSQVSFPALNVAAGEEFAYSIRLLSTDLDPARTLRQGVTVTADDMFYLICLNKNGNNGTSSVRVFKNITGTNVSNDTKGLTTSVTLPRALTDEAIKLTLSRVKVGTEFKWYIAVEQGEIKQIVELTQGGVPEELKKLDALKFNLGVGGMDDRVGTTLDNNVIWGSPTLAVGENAVSDYKYTAEVTVERDESDTDSTAVLSKTSFVYGEEVTLTITPKAPVGDITYDVTSAKLNGISILETLVKNEDGIYTFTYKINSSSDCANNELVFQIKIEKLEIAPPSEIAWEYDKNVVEGK